jgi:predicted CXXCH cytochrome family protein
MIKDNSKRKENKIMKKILLTLSLVLLAVVFMYGSANAISGICSSCHTMHASQDGTLQGEGPNAHLLLAGCLACHTGSTGQTSSYGAPAVLHTTDPVVTQSPGQGAGATNAGGDFYWVAQGGAANDSKGHNIAEIELATDENMPNLDPPGFDDSFTSAVASGVWDEQLTCAGEFGCHGDHSADNDAWAGIKGAHHENDGVDSQAVDETTVGLSYRFLLGINGLENADWNWNESAITHNEYFGTDNTGDREAGGEVGSGDDLKTISYLCAECHGLFHGSIEVTGSAGSPWKRHPTDIMLEVDYGGGYASETASDTNLYSVEAPVARPTVPATSSSSVTEGTDSIVMCLSCHRAHGSPQPDLLRWAYSDMDAGGTNGSGCFTCHADKNNN